ncbi:hypothetical protein FFLO_02935 [Filobasidium floriforme]|uniref:Uncharacterized protein n=1 Tax=Filobasidium floriforme TaxID=5210 RepID=A0A8K0NNQ0_9TREE|nr:hypothetical protein FFLO_02935 [Filobasidium floriforme]
MERRANKRWGLGSQSDENSTAHRESNKDFVEKHLLGKKNSKLGYLADVLGCTIAHFKSLVPHPLKVSNCDSVLMTSLFMALEEEQPDAMRALKRIMDSRDEQKPNIEQEVGLELAGLFMLRRSDLMAAEYEPQPRGEPYDLDLDDKDLPEGFKDLVQRLRSQLANL